MTDSASTILRTKSLTRKFGSLIAVDALNLNVEKNIIFGLIGPNGAGKSTLIKMLTTLLAPSAGDAYIDGVSIVKQPRKIRELIGYVPQLISADGALTAYENLMFFAQLYNIPRKERKIRVMEALALMNLTDVAHKLVNTYSGGMIRRLEIVQAMLHRPRILFLDEPTIGLDIIARNNLWEYLKTAHIKFNITVFLTTHDLEEADKLCDQVAIMGQGKIIISGTPTQLKQSIGQDNVTLDDVFVKYGNNFLTQATDYKAIVRQRKTERFLKR
jgi:ABC-2 type transport system ATP-binding protein